ncbi:MULTISPECIES: acyltransferase family protein [Pseudomonas]|uniref:Peptidoglycan/LPS O-acetylase OafA/YrhL, contains acyltransferase and SGNH-hydrolase domains n=1 Tax=Pseudomonas lutea TaxID=243924 RepID=A0A9X8QL34_9PSED|nr:MULTISPECIES: acyltransferase [Pseudomonas]SER16110.1 Peptidoglycan/LPS O-acetylase OafA/YrhL, contains acyltransferase and SGNH-hydrolase domains [Pseudomonas lutea]
MTMTFGIISLYIISLFVLDHVFNKTTILSSQALLRSSPLDALRGLLATSVVCSHFFVTYNWKATGEWGRSDNTIMNNMGAVPVSMFFMITGFLFFGKIYNKSSIDWKRVFSSRVKRIMPLYVFAVLVVAAVSFYQTQFHLVSLPQLVKEIIRWGIFKGSSFNGFEDSWLITAGVQWTLKYEWFFYLLLPVLAALLNRQGYGWYLAGSLLVALAVIPAHYFHFIDASLGILFLAGFLPVLVKNHRPHWISKLRSKPAAVLAVVLIGISMGLDDYFSLLQVSMLGIAFLIMALGNDLFGLLSRRGLKTLGEISYSIYLLHGIVLYVVFTLCNGFAVTGGSVTSYLAFLPFILLLVCGISTITFLMIEKPFILKPKQGIEALAPPP